MTHSTQPPRRLPCSTRAFTALPFGALLLLSLGPLSCVPANDGPEVKDGTDSNTHWLERCDADTQCGGLQCLCGVCTKACDVLADCGGLAADAVCTTDACEGSSVQQVGICSREAEASSSSAAPDGGPVSGDSSGPLSSDSGGPLSSDSGGPDADCQDGGAGCPVALDVRPGCELLLPRAGNSTCLGEVTQCEQAQTDERLREYHFESTDPLALQCARDFLVDSGFDATLSADGVVVVGSAKDLTGLTEANVLNYEVTCGTELCDYCFDAEQAECEADAFCAARQGTPIADGATCYSPARFVSCLPFEHGCDEALGAARDESGQCWNLNSLCYEPNLTYLDGNDPEESCQRYEEPCATDEQAALACRALETTTTNDGCFSPGMYSYDGEECYALSCGCVGPDCDQIWSSDGECETAHVACSDDLVTCDELMLPLQTSAIASFHYAPDTDLSAFAEWTAAEWSEPFALPNEPVPCDPPELAGDSNWCGMALGLTLTRGEQQVVRLDVTATGLMEIALSAGTPIEFRLSEREFLVRDPVDLQPYLMIGNGINVDNPVSQLWSVGSVRVRAATPYCRSVANECGRVAIAQSLTVMTTSTPEIERPFEEELLQLAPLTGADLSIEFGSVLADNVLPMALFRIQHGQSQYITPGECDAEPRLDSFSLVRIQSEP